ncbi:hypothetical protein Pmar_PMAR008884 [Perkinsus marinus ATCC 50983]|uniref:Uncharacterized protein n=1 Tax=Perkinsus marinus (strain ATCC 50983 / TXsc) TaxID=423536 RepID=C5KA94_PERM5|nr:hypothetical protein Pmar_PMAR008884 [Perkinsus marinus ATCC 50983]EER18555.1 hypothetical protein Pmar_PMAR008884 [Perkinsus marinus ATCC 50983]|eukprot:XP_002786759.1 hypothetical protein Pmar_PMAR008884 [Perkinsus marinus ATCC 50983]
MSYTYPTRFVKLLENYYEVHYVHRDERSGMAFCLIEECHVREHPQLADLPYLGETLSIPGSSASDPARLYHGLWISSAQTHGWKISLATAPDNDTTTSRAGFIPAVCADNTSSGFSTTHQ